MYMDPNILSDHCEVCFSLKCNSMNTPDIEHDGYIPIKHKYIWKNEYTTEYQAKIKF